MPARSKVLAKFDNQVFRQVSYRSGDLINQPNMRLTENGGSEAATDDALPA